MSDGAPSPAPGLTPQRRKEETLDALLRHCVPGDGAIDLVGHSMGGNVAMFYAGARPARIRRLVNLEGFGMPASRPAQAPRRTAQWLDELQQLAQLWHDGRTSTPVRPAH